MPLVPMSALNVKLSWLLFDIEPVRLTVELDALCECEGISSADKKGVYMSVFQILDGSVLVIDGDKSYSDTVEHFKADAGVAVTPSSVVYDTKQKCCVVDGDWLAYPNALYQSYIDRVAELIAAKAKREYVAPAEPTAEEKKAAALAQLKADYDAAVESLTADMATALLRGDTDAQKSIQSDFADLQDAYKEESEAL